MLLGVDDVKADTWVNRFVSDALGREVTAAESRQLVSAVAKSLKVAEVRLDHAIWSHQRNA
jgi:hypothetical protein